MLHNTHMVVTRPRWQHTPCQGHGWTLELAVVFPSEQQLPDMLQGSGSGQAVLRPAAPMPSSESRRTIMTAPVVCVCERG